MNDTTKKITDWIQSEPELAAFLRDIARGEPVPPDGEIYEYGDQQLGCWIADLLDDLRNGAWWDVVAGNHVSVTRIDALREELAQGRGRFDYLDEMDVEQIRRALLPEDD